MYLVRVFLLTKLFTLTLGSVALKIGQKTHVYFWKNSSQCLTDSKYTFDDIEGIADPGSPEIITVYLPKSKNAKVIFRVLGEEVLLQFGVGGEIIPGFFKCESFDSHVFELRAAPPPPSAELSKNQVFLSRYASTDLQTPLRWVSKLPTKTISSEELRSGSQRELFVFDWHDHFVATELTGLFTVTRFIPRVFNPLDSVELLGKGVKGLEVKFQTVAVKPPVWSYDELAHVYQTLNEVPRRALSHTNFPKLLSNFIFSVKRIQGCKIVAVEQDELSYITAKVITLLGQGAMRYVKAYGKPNTMDVYYEPFEELLPTEVYLHVYLMEKWILRDTLIAKVTKHENGDIYELGMNQQLRRFLGSDFRLLVSKTMKPEIWDVVEMVEPKTETATVQFEKVAIDKKLVVTVLENILKDGSKQLVDLGNEFSSVVGTMPFFRIKMKSRPSNITTSASTYRLQARYDGNYVIAYLKETQASNRNKNPTYTYLEPRGNNFVEPLSTDELFLYIDTRCNRRLFAIRVAFRIVPAVGQLELTLTKSIPDKLSAVKIDELNSTYQICTASKSVIPGNETQRVNVVKACPYFWVVDNAQNTPTVVSASPVSSDSTRILSSTSKKMTSKSKLMFWK